MKKKYFFKTNDIEITGYYMTLDTDFTLFTINPM